MIELVANRLSPSERDRWRAIILDAPLAARISVADPAVRAVGAILCSLAFLVSLDGAGHGSLVSLIRVVGLGTLTFAIASTFESMRGGESPWPNGRFVLAWGFVEVANGVLRAFPRSELRHDIRGRWLGLGQMRLTLRAGRWTTSIPIERSEAERIVAAWAEHAEEPARAATGYREPAQSRELTSGPTPRWTPPSFLVRLLLAIVVAPLAFLVSPPAEQTGMPAPEAPVAIAPVPISTYTDHFAAALHSAPEADVSVHLERCTMNEMMAGTVASYLMLGLERRRIGPAHLGAIPFFSFTREAPTPVRIWAGCTWSVDPETGMFDQVRARWGVMRDGVPQLERRATIDVATVTGALATCRDGEPLSPYALADVSLRLTSLVIQHDVQRGAWGGGFGGSEASRDAWCLLSRAHAVPVRTVTPGS